MIWKAFSWVSEPSRRFMMPGAWMVWCFNAVHYGFWADFPLWTFNRPCLGAQTTPQADSLGAGDPLRAPPPPHPISSLGLNTQVNFAKGLQTKPIVMDSTGYTWNQTEVTFCRKSSAILLGPAAKLDTLLLEDASLPLELQTMSDRKSWAGFSPKNQSGRIKRLSQ